MAINIAKFFYIFSIQFQKVCVKSLSEAFPFFQTKYFQFPNYLLSFSLRFFNFSLRKRKHTKSQTKISFGYFFSCLENHIGSQAKKKNKKCLNNVHCFTRTKIQKNHIDLYTYSVTISLIA